MIDEADIPTLILCTGVESKMQKRKYGLMFAYFSRLILKLRTVVLTYVEKKVQKAPERLCRGLVVHGILIWSN